MNFKFLFWGILAVLLCSCGAWEFIPGESEYSPDMFVPKDYSSKTSSLEAIQGFKEEIKQTENYLLYDGDLVTLEVVGRQELNGQHRIGPDGRITLPVAGPIKIRNMSREEAAASIMEAFKLYYSNIYVTVRVDDYSSNRVIVIGRVENPGYLQFDTPPSLLEILAKAGGLPLLRKEQVLTRCALIRNDRILWVDLKRLLMGDTSLNVPLQRNDIVYIPDSADTSVFVLGAVNQPGVFRLTPQMSFIDALAQAGGIHKDGNGGELHLIRISKGINREIDLSDLLEPDPQLNVALEEGDIIYVPRHGVSKIGYVLQQINPFSTLFTISQLGAVVAP
jgi:polysaccharide export outer membrane protein